MDTKRLIALAIGFVAASQVPASENGQQFTSLAGFELARDATLADVLQKFGPAPLVEFGESAGYRASICYAAKTALVGFLSEEMGGPNHRLLGFSVAQTGAEAKSKCGTLTGQIAPAELELGGLKLGMSKKEFSTLLGRQVGWIRGIGRRSYESQEPVTAAERSDIEFSRPGASVPRYWNVVVSVFGTFKEDRLIEYEVWKIRTL